MLDKTWLICMNGLFEANYLPGLLLTTEMNGHQCLFWSSYSLWICALDHTMNYTWALNEIKSQINKHWQIRCWKEPLYFYQSAGGCCQRHHKLNQPSRKSTYVSYSYILHTRFRSSPIFIYCTQALKKYYYYYLLKPSNLFANGFKWMLLPWNWETLDAGVTLTTIFSN